MSIYAKAKVLIRGTRDAWSLTQGPETSDTGQFCDVSLEIEGNDRDGYYLVMIPSGFFPADYWYETEQETLDNAEELFEIKQNKWDEFEIDFMTTSPF